MWIEEVRLFLEILTILQLLQAKAHRKLRKMVKTPLGAQKRKRKMEIVLFSDHIIISDKNERVIIQLFQQSFEKKQYSLT